MSVWTEVVAGVKVDSIATLAVALGLAAVLPCLLAQCLSHAVCCMQIQNTKKKTGVIPPKKFVQRLKRDNEQFCSYMHQVWLATAFAPGALGCFGLGSPCMKELCWRMPPHVSWGCKRRSCSSIEN